MSKRNHDTTKSKDTSWLQKIPKPLRQVINEYSAPTYDNNVVIRTNWNFRSNDGYASIYITWNTDIHESWKKITKSHVLKFFQNKNKKQFFFSEVMHQYNGGTDVKIDDIYIEKKYSVGNEAIDMRVLFTYDENEKNNLNLFTTRKGEKIVNDLNQYLCIISSTLMQLLLVPSKTHEQKHMYDDEALGYTEREKKVIKYARDLGLSITFLNYDVANDYKLKSDKVYTVDYWKKMLSQTPVKESYPIPELGFSLYYKGIITLINNKRLRLMGSEDIITIPPSQFKF